MLAMDCVRPAPLAESVRARENPAGSSPAELIRCPVESVRLEEASLLPAPPIFVADWKALCWDAIRVMLMF